MVDMILKKIPSTTVTTEESRPLFLKGGEEAVLLLHGYNGHPGDLVPVAHKLHSEGFTVFLPRLPGHGTNAADFFQTTHLDWIRHAVDTFYDIRGSYKKIHLVGFSMGSLIALYLSSYYRVDSIAVVNPAIIFKQPLMALITAIALFIKKIPRKSNIAHESESQKILFREYWAWYYPPMLAELKRMNTKARKRLRYTVADLFVIASTKDELVRVEGADYILKSVSSTNKSKMIFENSPHFCIGGPEKNEIIAAVLHWLKTR